MLEVSTALVRTEAAWRALEEARTVDEIKDVRNKAEALRLYAKQAGLGLEMQNTCAEIKLQAERRAGGMLAETEKNPGTVLGGNIVQPPSDIPKLADLGLSKTQSSRWQLEARVPEGEFEAWVAEVKGAKEELTSVGLRGLALRLAGNQRAQNPAILPKGKFSVVYADPPWQYDFSKVTAWGVPVHYDTLPTEDIANYKDDRGTPLQDVIPDEAVLFLWAPQPKLKDALEVIEAWGFKYTTGAIWVKDRLGMGYWWMQKHELLLLGKRGNFPAPATGARPESVFEVPWTGHSKKPALVYEMIERMCPLPDAYRGLDGKYYLECFARGNARPYWAGFGKEYNNSE